ncbi:lysophospholipid acyltransferase family protein [Varunaivibrio sulfuroxidans]|uniref:1-acyl-sn-glycerol-3-phosphate acyltransferase n=1 Tax=Varunaivibrio sulfuroxidans TaxID=1773489 RepID=A0A4R3JBV9_9PROT|nr:1-acyl-sn-glycerol-3-phosphate acyltransferase [Varunaivibrio sulfuroxidans]TCS63519.1 1-acyl-sn-glycerol-3-phosphate acyltransferase [Varunaivibrio sulfuroxidans]WES30336.1 1-acyl-sn-glycerol-3-phosphate acyltransferase [Varunaivibrio sulfuroxidans]
MLYLRSFIFNLAFYAFSTALTIAMLFVVPFSGKNVHLSFGFWIRAMAAMLKGIVGLDHQFLGLENLPEGKAIIACKHQSAWETGIFYLLSKYPAYVLKKELLSIPIYGQCLKKTEMIAVDRGAGGAALKTLLRGANRALKDARQVIIFPEGTRASPDVPGAYHPGIWALYKSAGIPVIPAAVNSGLFWPRRSFLKRPGRITMEFLEPIAPGLDRETFMKTLRTRMDEATARLVAQARATYPSALPPA